MPGGKNEERRVAAALWLLLGRSLAATFVVTAATFVAATTAFAARRTIATLAAGATVAVSALAARTTIVMIAARTTIAVAIAAAESAATFTARTAVTVSPFTRGTAALALARGRQLLLGRRRQQRLARQTDLAGLRLDRHDLHFHLVA